MCEVMSNNIAFKKPPLFSKKKTTVKLEAEKGEHIT